MSPRPVVTRRQRPEELGTRRDERGEVIILVLAILVVVGILVGALAGLATPIFAHATVVRNVNDTVSAADSGIQYGIQTIQSNLQSNPGLCPTGGAGLNPPSVNGRTVQVTCATSTSLPSSGGISYIVLTSTIVPGVGTGRVISARAVVQVNDATGATTIESWRTCQDGPC